jgi:hypothetical protein
MATTAAAAAATTTLQESTGANASFYHRVSFPEDILETMLRTAMVFAEHENRMTIHVQDVEHALELMKFTITTPLIEERDRAFGHRVRQLMNRQIKADLAFTDGALSLLKLVEAEYQNEENSVIEVHGTPKGGRFLKLESPKGVSVGFFEYDWSSNRGMEDNKANDAEEEDDEWNNAMEEAGDGHDNADDADDSSDDESMIRRAILVENEDEEYQQELDKREEPWFTVIKP